MIDIAIIGGGPAGLAAGLYAARGGASVTLYEEVFVGGQAAKTQRIDNYPGFADGIDGFEIGVKLAEHAEKFGLTVAYTSVLSVALSGAEKELTLADGSQTARAVILATGATPRPLGLPRETELTGHGVSYCATCDGAFFRGKSVAVVGGGDTAIADALYLARFVERVTVVHRRDALRASAALQKQAFSEPKIGFCWNSVADALEGESAVTGLTVKNVQTGERTTLPVSGVFAAVGIVPHTALFAGQVALAADGSVRTDPKTLMTDIPGVFAAGDVRDTPLRQVVTACADGALAATGALSYLASI